MQHLLIDLAKCPTKYKKLPFQHSQICLFAKQKQAKKLITPQEPHSIYVLPKDNAAHSIIQAAKEILTQHPNHPITFVSPRKKILLAIDELKQDYPETSIAYFKKYGKKAKKHIKQQKAYTKFMNSTQATATEQASNEQEEERCISETIQRINHAAAVFTLLEQQQSQEPKTDQEILTTLLLLKKNRPKKKNDLVHLLTHTRQGSQEKALELVIKLQEAGYIKIDAAENVRYQ